jgi:hypothetical protein
MSDAEDKTAMYDRSDLGARGIMYFLIALALTVVIIHLVSWGVVRFFAASRVAPAPRNAAVILPSAQVPKGNPALVFPAPRLQPDEVTDLDKFRAASEEKLNTSGAGHIPIEQAMEAVAKNGLPVRPQPALPPSARFGSGDGTLAGAGGGTEPKGNQ